MSKLSLPHERRKASLQAKVIQTKVRIAEHKATLERAKSELQAMTPKRKPNPEVI